MRAGQLRAGQMQAKQGTMRLVRSELAVDRAAPGMWLHITAPHLCIRNSGVLPAPGRTCLQQREWNERNGSK